MCTIVDTDVFVCPVPENPGELLIFVNPMVQNCVQISGAALALYDYFLMFNDEIRYVWKGRKSWLFCIYILYRALLIGYHSWRVFVIINTLPPWDSDYYNNRHYVDTHFIQPILFAAFLFFSDIFVTLRIYAISCRNKIFTTYIAALAIARLSTSLTLVGFSDELVDSILDSPWYKIATVSVGTALEISAFAIIVWYTYRNRGMLKFLPLVRTIVMQAGVWFIAIVVTQIYVQASLRSTYSRFFLYSREPTLFSVYGLVLPVLTLRFVISLRKSADPEGGQKWKLEHFSSMKFASSHPADSHGSVALESFEMEPFDPSYGEMQTRKTRGPMGEIALGDV